LIFFGGEKYIINGVIDVANKTITKERKQSRSNYIIPLNYINDLCDTLSNIDSLITTKLKEDIEKNFGVFHDVKNSVGIVQSCMENYLAVQPGSEFTEKLRNCDKNLQDLYDAMKLVNSQLGMIDIMVNTKSINQGNRHYINVFKLFHRLAKLFQYKASKKEIQIVWSDNSQIVPDILAYQSFEFVPLILFDNAIKYTTPNNKVNINFEIIQNEIRIVVSNYGKTVPNEQKDTIFDKYIRGSNAEDCYSGGIGMGLWVAKKIIKYHNGKIWYEATSFPLGLNKFNITLPLTQ
jgi:K+-sensing histidine kinase KdpD